MASNNSGMEFGHELKIPKERIAVLIGKEGDIKKKIEKETQTSIFVDSTEGTVLINGKDALKMFTAKEVVRAIARGFNPEIALTLLKQDNCLEIITIPEFARNKSDVKRLKGRVIGEKGRSRSTIEALTDTQVSVYGKTVGIIGEVASVGIARKAVESLLSGSPHANVYKWLEKQRRNIKKEEADF